MSKVKNNARKVAANNEVQSLRDRANAFDDKAVNDTIALIEASIERRDNAANNGGGSWLASRKLINDNKVAVARYCLALGIAPSDVIENRVVSSSLFNAKALKKVVELARFVVNGDKRIEKVLSAFILCSLKVASATDSAISNRINQRFLSSADVSKLVNDESLAEYIAENQHKFMTGGAPTQSSQARRVLEVCGLADIQNDDSRYRGAIALKRDHAFYELFVADFCK